MYRGLVCSTWCGLVLSGTWHGLFSRGVDCSDFLSLIAWFGFMIWLVWFGFVVWSLIVSLFCFLVLSFSLTLLSCAVVTCVTCVPLDLLLLVFSIDPIPSSRHLSVFGARLGGVWFMFVLLLTFWFADFSALLL